MKVLIVSHNPITTYHNMGKTFLSLFSAFDKSELCQLYIYPTIPDIDVCNSYYRITDRQVANSIYRFGKVKSRCIEKSEIDLNKHSMFETDDEKAFLKKRSKKAFTLLCRDFVWACSRWYNKGLKDWLRSEKPTCIFLAPGQSKFIYNIALKIAKKLKIDLYTYICDEYYFIDNTKGLVAKLHHGLLKKKIKKTMVKSKSVIAICNELSEVYEKEFGVKTYTVFTGATIKRNEKDLSLSDSKCVTYMGNIGCGRIESLLFIGEKLDELNSANGTDYRLLVYSFPFSNEEKQMLSKVASIHYMGYVAGNEFQEVFKNTKIHLYVESFSEVFIERLKHSISTKIADALSSGNLLFAYGPRGIASIEHLVRNDCAVVVTSPNELKQTLYEVLEGMDTECIIKNALKTAENCHSSPKNSGLLYSILSQ